MTGAGTVGAVRPIRRLAQSVADAIAAGEVVERPASVVKELCENSVDAGATSIDVVVDGAGTVRISVVDDGAGIGVDELPLALARHATSKIHAVTDLEAVATLGFRGEALASIAAVADLTMSSRTATSQVGARLRVRHGERVEEGSCGGPVGTTVEVRDLFAATPARLRFLRAERAETAAAIAVVSDLVLARPELRISCVVDGRTRLRAPGGGLEHALRAVFGTDASDLLPVAVEGDINVGGAISEPRRHRSARTGLVLVVNGRRVHNRAMLAAVAEAYRGLVPAGRYPYGVVSVELDPLEVDVNVHPTKREVRCRDERRVFGAVQRACWHTLRGASVYSFSGVDGAALQLNEASPGAGPGAQPAANPPAMELDGRTAQLSRTSLQALRPLRALGQQGGRWLLAASPAGVVVVDPHAAHEKVIYTGLLAEWSDGDALGQLLLLPALVECDARRMELFVAHEALVASCGFTVEPFGPTTLRCTSVPAGAAAADPSRLLGELLDSLGAGGPVTEQRHRAAALIACHAAVRFGDELAHDQQQQLLDRLVETSGGVTCPHGRPTVTVFDDAMLRRVFRRPPA
ncbi:MAG: DNA mismatch repair endonuclease MutL [Candidatus Dormibacteraeota bacterium]|nr:DNA mismatch repair endonuclease MutL [Candidatus Dormibacteraeota bacterium]